MPLLRLNAPAPLADYPFVVGRDALTGEARLEQSIRDTFHARHASLNTAVVHVDPIHGLDTNAGTAGAPLRTLTAAMASSAGTIVLAGGVYDTSNDFATVRDKVITTTGPVVIRGPGSELSGASWSDEGGGVASTAFTGDLRRLLDHEVVDANGDPVGLRQFSSLTELRAATEGWFRSGQALYVKRAGEDPADPDYGDDLEGLYAGRIRAAGASVLLDGDIELRGVTAEAYARNGVMAEIWATEAVTSNYAYAHAFYGQGAWLVLQGVTIHSPLNDGINANPEGDIRSLIVDDHVTVNWSGDRRTFFDVAPAQRQHSSAHGGTDHISVGGVARHAFGEGVADTSITQSISYSWIVDFDAGETQATGAPSRAGLSFWGFNRLAWVEGVSGDATLIDGTVLADRSHVFFRDVDGTIHVLGGGVAYAPGSGVVVNAVAGTTAGDALTGTEGRKNLLDGRAGNDQLTGASGRDVLSGGDGDDLLRGLGGDDVLVGGLGADRLEGGAGNDTADYHRATAGVTVNLRNGTASGAEAQGDVLVSIETVVGSDFNDVLYGGAGVTTLIGGAGDDWYFVEGDDVIVEYVGRGANDRAFASSHYVLGAGVSIEILSTDNHAGTAAINLTGNALANVIHGNAGANALSGRDGDDILYGQDGNDVLDGGAGADVLVGGMGDDWYHVDNARDVLRETAGQGANDRLFASVSYVLGAGVEVETMSTNWHAGTTATDLTGNEFAQAMYGNEGANSLRGMAGNDILRGNGGDDVLEGGEGVDYLFGGDGGDVLQGGAGNDFLYGDAGTNDRAVFQGVQSEYTIVNLGGGRWRVTDSVAGRDGVDILEGIETLQFLNRVDLPQSAVTEGKDDDPLTLPLEDAGSLLVLPVGEDAWSL